MTGVSYYRDYMIHLSAVSSPYAHAIAMIHYKDDKYSHRPREYDTRECDVRERNTRSLCSLRLHREQPHAPTMTIHTRAFTLLTAGKSQLSALNKVSGIAHGIKISRISFFYTPLSLGAIAPQSERKVRRKKMTTRRGTGHVGENALICLSVPSATPGIGTELLKRARASATMVRTDHDKRLPLLKVATSGGAEREGVAARENRARYFNKAVREYCTATRARALARRSTSRKTIREERNELNISQLDAIIWPR